MRRAVVLVGVAVALAVLFFHVPSAYQTSARQGIQWLLDYPEEYGNQVVFWALKDINTRFCRSDEFAQKIAKRFESVPRTEVEKAYFYFPEFPITEEVLTTARAARYDTWLLESLSCHEREVSSAVQAELLSIQNAGGYDLTHKYTALLYLERIGCTLDGTVLPELIQVAEEKIIKEEGESTGFNDLSAERAALLLWAGRRDLVDDGWLSRILAAQDASGGWGDGVGAKPNPHTTALALWTLAQARSQCPL